MAGEKENPAAVVAGCPICNENIPLENMNSHIDICLLAAERGAPIPCGSVPAQELGHKITSPAPIDGKQSLLSFSKRESPGVGGHPPPAKKRLASTPKGSRSIR